MHKQFTLIQFQNINNKLSCCFVRGSRKIPIFSVKKEANWEVEKIPTDPRKKSTALGSDTHRPAKEIPAGKRLLGMNWSSSHSSILHRSS